MYVEIEKIMDRQKIADSINTIMDTGIDLLSKKKLDPGDYGKIKVIRTLGTHINAAVTMVQQETAQLRAKIVSERMEQLGFISEPKKLENKK